LTTGQVGSKIDLERRAVVVQVAATVRSAFCVFWEVTMNHAAPIRSSQVALRRSPLTELLIEIREKTNKSQAEIARDSWLNESYVSRLFSGERTNPSRDALILLRAFGLELQVPEVDELLLAADYKQLVLPQSLR